MRNARAEVDTAAPDIASGASEAWLPMATDPAPTKAAHNAPAIAVSTVSEPHRFLVSDAVPLYLFGLAPPPPEIGPHLLNATPLEAALAAAAATAEVLAIAPIRIEPELEPELEQVPDRKSVV